MAKFTVHTSNHVTLAVCRIQLFVNTNLTLLHTHSVGRSDWALKLMVEIARREGPHHLMRGLGPRLIAVPSYMSVFYVVNEELEWYLLNKKLIN